MSTDLTVTPTFKAAASEYGAALVNAERKAGIARHAVMTLVAVGFLSKMTRKEINLRGRETSGATEATWYTGKTIFSQAWRAIAGEYGARETLAKMWAAKDYTITLDKAYELSSGPAKEVDVVESLARKLATLSAQDVQDVLSRYVEISETLAYAHENIQAIVKLNVEEIIRVAAKVA